MCPQQYSTILALLFQTEVFAQQDESERLHTSFDLMHVSVIAVERIQHLNTEFRTEVKKVTLSTI